MRLGWLLGTAVALWAQARSDPTDVLMQARDKIVERTRQAPNYTCVLTVTHNYYQSTKTERASSCDQVIGQSKGGSVLGRLEATDRVRLDVKVSSGIEIGSLLGARQFDSRSILDLVRGSFEAGTLGPLLQDVFQNDATDFEFIGEKTTGSSTELEYTYRVPAAESHYHIRAERDWFGQVPYDGSLRIDSTSFDLTHLAAKVYEPPPEVQACLVTTTVDYRRERVGQGDFLMPKESVLQALRTDGSASETALVYSGCREYSSESTVRFGGDNATDVSRPQAGTGRIEPLPAGVKFSVALTQPIDTDTAAGGDAITGTVRRAVSDLKSKAVLIPAGALVHGRIVRMEHFPGSHFVIALQLESLETPSGEMPIYAIPDSTRTNQRDQTEAAELSRPGMHILLPPAGNSRNTAALVFRTSGKRYVVEAGYPSDWITVAPPAKP